VGQQKKKRDRRGAQIDTPVVGFGSEDVGKSDSRGGSNNMGKRWLRI